MICFTSITNNYLPKAAVLAASVRKHYPQAKFYVVLCDTAPPDLPRVSKAFDRIILATDLKVPVPSVEQWIFQHTVVELCTAVKGPFLVHLLEESQADKVVYFDPDIVVLNPLHELEALLDRHSIILTPHLTEPEQSYAAVLDNEVCALKHGVFNLGFLAIRNTAEGRRFARWWSDRLVEFCYDDIQNGLFTDQKWIDLAPAFFSDFLILRDKTYNVATWNLAQRKVEKNSSGTLCIEGSPIKFFHFSGFDSGAQLAMLNKYGKDSPALFELRDWYVAELERAGQAEYSSLPWGYACFSNGKPISTEQRRTYRDRMDVIKTFPHPAEVIPGKPNYYEWSVYNGEPARPPGPIMRMLRRWRRSIRKRLPFLPKPYSA